MKIVCAPDSFKGSASALEVAQAISRGVRETFPQAVVIPHPLTDGGEGTLEVLSAYGFQLSKCEVRNQRGDLTPALFALKGNVAVIESAKACGFDPGASPKDALEASSVGVGELILKALDQGVNRIMVTVGGTSSTDGGVGMLEALGFDFLDVDGHPIPPGGQGLLSLAAISAERVDQRLSLVDISVLTDVDNPLLGAHGAAAIFAPQKGADSDSVALLEEGLARLATLAPGSSVDSPGAGAGGGIGFGAMAFLGATRTSGATALIELTGFEQVLEDCDVVITGEGSFDDQSLSGKIPSHVIHHASSRGIPVYVVCGVDRLKEREVITATTVREIIALSSLEPDSKVSIENAEALLEQVGQEIGLRLQRG